MLLSETEVFPSRDTVVSVLSRKELEVVLFPKHFQLPLYHFVKSTSVAMMSLFESVSVQLGKYVCLSFFRTHPPSPLQKSEETSNKNNNSELVIVF